MTYLNLIREFGGNPEQLEIAYQSALQQGEAQAFNQAVDEAYAEKPDNLLFAAWHFRLAHAAAAAKAWAIAWGYAIPLALLNGLIFWLLSDDQRFMIRMVNPAADNATDFLPLIFLIWAPISAAFVMLYLALAGKRQWRWLATLTAGLALIIAYVLIAYHQAGPRVFQEQYLTLAIIHVALLAWASVGIYLLVGFGDVENRFDFLIKSLEIFITAGLFVIAGGLFVGITAGLFEALDVHLSELVIRLLVAGGGGMIPVLVVAILYNPNAEPAQQSFDEGLSKLIAVLMRALLPLSLLVLLIYLAFIPFNFRQPFENRDVLIIYNAMLFAIMALLLGATPVHQADISERMAPWLRRGIIALAGLAVLVGLYALAAILYRTWQDRLTPNRLTFIGWNIVNIGILIALLVRQIGGKETWLNRLQSAFAAGAVVYCVWAVVVVLTLPWMFGIRQGNVEALPTSVQRIVYAEAYPILLKCSGKPHVYLLEDGQKRWIKDIPTFEAEGYEWRQVRRISCTDLDAVPAGLPIPEDAGTPPEP